MTQKPYFRSVMNILPSFWKITWQVLHCWKFIMASISSFLVLEISNFSNDHLIYKCAVINPSINNNININICSKYMLQALHIYTYAPPLVSDTRELALCKDLYFIFNIFYYPLLLHINSLTGCYFNKHKS